MSPWRSVESVWAILWLVMQKWLKHPCCFPRRADRVMGRVPLLLLHAAGAAATCLKSQAYGTPEQRGAPFSGALRRAGMGASCDAFNGCIRWMLGVFRVFSSCSNQSASTQAPTSRMRKRAKRPRLSCAEGKLTRAGGKGRGRLCSFSIQVLRGHEQLPPLDVRYQYDRQWPEFMREDQSL